MTYFEELYIDNLDSTIPNMLNYEEAFEIFEDFLGKVDHIYSKSKDENREGNFL